MVDLPAAYATCRRLARARHENFPVASLLLPRRMRDHVAALYAFARTADDFADEGERTPGERLALIESWSRRLHGLDTAPPRSGEPASTLEIFAALHATMASCALPTALLDDLLSAFRQDVTVHRYESWPQLLDYCRRSANPVGRLVLRVAGHDEPRADAWSDAICTALQLTNFWQDTEIDRARGRVYLPADTPAREALRRTRNLFEAGRPLCDWVRGRLRYELRATWLGGTRILDRLEGDGRRGARPALGPGDAPWLAWRLLAWDRGAAG